MTVVAWWQGSRYVVDWTLTDDAGTPVSTATVTGVVSLPGGGTAPMTVTNTGNVYRGAYTVAAAGLHGWKLTAAGAAVGVEEGEFVAQRSKVGLPPITVDPTTDIGLVRLLCTDLSETEPLFTDAQIEAFLTLEGDSVKLAAAQALDTIASNEALVSKAIRTMDLQTDGPAVAAELRARAKELRDQAGGGDGTDENGDPWGFDFVDYDPYAAYRVP